MEQKRKLIAVAWIAMESRGTHRLYKVFERPDSGHAYEEVSEDKEASAWMWLRLQGKKTLGRSHGIWFRGHPGLIWTSRFEDIQNRAGDMRLAPVRFKFGAALSTYKHMTTTRSRHEMWRLRAMYPSASELAWTPKSVLIDRFGVRDEMGRQISPPAKERAVG